MKTEVRELWSTVGVALASCALLAMPAILSGCAEKEKVLDIETPNAEIEVVEDRETGERDVEIERDAPE